MKPLFKKRSLLVVVFRERQHDHVPEKARAHRGKRTFQQGL